MLNFFLEPCWIIVVQICVCWSKLLCGYVAARVNYVWIYGYWNEGHNWLQFQIVLLMVTLASGTLTYGYISFGHISSVALAPGHISCRCVSFWLH